MGCCGQRRAALVQGIASGQMPAPAGPSVRIAFTQATSVLVRGPATGRHYQFHPGAETQPVDPRDAASLLKSGYFRPA